MAYIGNQPAPSNINSDSITDGSITNADISPSAAIDVSKLDGVTATNTELNKLDGVTSTTADLNLVAGADAAGVTASDIQKAQYLSGVSSDIQTQLNSASGGAVKGTLTKTFAANETATIALSSASTPTPMVAVTKEVPQVGVSAKGNWDVRADGSNYDIEDTAYSVTLTPSVADDDGVFTLGSGSFASTDVGKRIVGNGGVAILKTTAGVYELVTAFTDTSTIASGDWQMYGLDFNTSQGLKMSGFYDNAVERGMTSDTNVIRRAKLPQALNNLVSMYMHDDGKTFHLFCYNTDTAAKISFETAWDSSEINVYTHGALYTRPFTNTSDFFKVTENHDGTRVNFTNEFDDGTYADQLNDNGGGVVYQYGLAEANNFETITSSPVGYLDFSSTDNLIKDVKFSADGTKYFLYGGETGILYTIDAGTAGQINPTDTEDNTKRIDLSGFTAAGSQFMGFTFSPDGYNLYVFSASTGSLSRLTLTTAWDTSTASFSETNNSFSQIRDMRINNTGTTIIWLDPNGPREATLGTAFSVDSATTTLDTSTYVAKRTNAATFADGYNYGWHWSDDGQYLFVNTNQKVARWTASEAFNIKSLYRRYYSETGASASSYLNMYGTGTPYGTSYSSYRGITLNPTGTKLYLCSETNDNSILELALTTAYDLSTATASNTYTATDGTNYRFPHSLTSAEDSSGNSYLYFATRTGTNYGFTKIVFGTAWDLSTASRQEWKINGQTDEYPFYGIAVNPTGSGIVVQSESSNYQYQTNFGDTIGRHYSYPLVQYSMPTPFSYNIEPSYEVNMFTDDMLPFGSYSPSSNNANPFNFNADGTSLFTAQRQGYELYEIKLEGLFSIAQERLRRTTGSNPIGSYQSASFGNYARAMQFSPDGTKLIVLFSYSGQPATLKRYSLTTAWDITTAGAPDQTYTFATTATYSFYKGLLADPTGTYFTTFRKDASSGGQWGGITLSSPWDLTSASFAVRTYTLNVTSGAPTSTPYATSDNDERDCINGFWFNQNGTVLSAYFRYSSSDSPTQHSFILNNAYKPVAGGASKGYVVGSTDPGIQDAINDAYCSTAIDYATGRSYITTYSNNYPTQAVDYPGTAGNAWDDWDSRYRIMTIAGAYTGNSTNSPNYSSASSTRQRNYLYAPNTYGVWNTLSSDGRYLYIININGLMYRMSVSGEYLKDVTPHDQYFPAITNNTGQVDTSPWTDINSMLATEAGSGDKYYAFSTDARTTFKIVHNTDGTRNIVRNNSGTWEYNSNVTYGSETWTSASSNDQFAAFREAMAVSQNRMNNSQLSSVTDSVFFAAEDTFDLAIILRSYEGQIGSPSSDGVSVNYDAAALNKGAILGTDYDYDVPSSTSVRITSLAAQNLKVKVL